MSRRIKKMRNGSMAADTLRLYSSSLHNCTVASCHATPYRKGQQRQRRHCGRLERLSGTLHVRRAHRMRTMAGATPRHSTRRLPQAHTHPRRRTHPLPTSPWRWRRRCCCFFFIASSPHGMERARCIAMQDGTLPKLASLRAHQDKEKETPKQQQQQQGRRHCGPCRVS